MGFSAIDGGNRRERRRHPSNLELASKRSRHRQARAARRHLIGWRPRRINREHRLVYRVTGKGDAQAQADIITEVGAMEFRAFS